MEESIGDARANTEFQVAEFDPNFLHRAGSADAENTKVGDLKPLLPIVAVLFLKGIEEVYADFGRLGFEFEVSGAVEAVVGSADVCGESHHAFASSR